MRESKQTEAQAPSAAAQSATIEVSDFEKLLQQEFKPKSEEANTAVQGAVNVLVEQALQNANLVSTDAIKTIEGMISELDKKLTAQVNEIMHHKDFEDLESAWRGLDYLVSHTETSDQLKIRVFNISKQELGKTLKKFKGSSWDQSWW